MAKQPFESLFDDSAELPDTREALDVSGLPAHGAVYALTDADGRLVQLAAGQNLRQSVSARMQEPQGARHVADLRGVARRVWWAVSHSQFETTLRFHGISRQLYPDGYARMCAFGPAWFGVIDTTERLPRWRVSNDPARGASACVGPFSQRSACETFCRHLDDLYDLCRYHNVLDQTPNGEACAYFEMGRCAAPCDGTVPVSAYLAEVRRSVAGVVAGGRKRAQELQQEMAQAAAERAFERAARLKEDLAAAESVARTLAVLACRFEDFRYLVVQRAGGRSWVKAFYVDRGKVTATEPVRLKEVDAAAVAWVKHLPEAHAGRPQPTDDATLLRERVWIVSHFLDRPTRSAGLFLRADRLPEAPQLAQRVRRTFGPAAQRKSE